MIEAPREAILTDPEDLILEYRSSGQRNLPDTGQSAAPKFVEIAAAHCNRPLRRPAREAKVIETLSLEASEVLQASRRHLRKWMSENPY